MLSTLNQGDRVKKVLVISTSMRSGANSDALADEFVKGAKAAKNDAVKINLLGKNISFCKGCLACVKTHKCTIKDDANMIVEMMKEADVIAFATPIYYYEMSGSMKNMLDRSNPLYGTDYKFKDTYLLGAAAEDEEWVIDGAKNGLDGWISCFENAKFKGKVFAGGVTNIGDIKNSKALKNAYDMGLGIA